MFKKFISSIVMVALVSMTSLLSPLIAAAAGSVTTATDTMSRLKASTASDHTFMFVTPTGVASGQTITLTFSSGFTGVSSMVSNDFDVAEGSTGVCSSATFTEKSVKTTPTASDFSAIGAGQVVTVLSGGASATLTAGRCIRIKAGLNATDATGSGSPTHQITNGPASAADTITIGGTFTDSGIISVEIMDSDQVSVTANVDQTMSFDLDTGITAGETGQPYSVPLGTLSSGSVTHSNGTSINQIFADGGTNAAGGMNISVRNANGASGLKSTSTPGDFIGSVTGPMSAGTANYGLCVDSATVTGVSRSTTYNTTCALASATNGVVGLTSTATDILTSSAPVTAHAQIVVNATIAAATPAHADYSDTLTFIATASF